MHTKGFAVAVVRPMCSLRTSLPEASFVSLSPLVHDAAPLASNLTRIKTNFSHRWTRIDTDVLFFRRWFRWLRWQFFNLPWRYEGHEGICLGIFDAYHPKVLISRQMHWPYRLRTIVWNLLSQVKPNPARINTNSKPQQGHQRRRKPALSSCRLCTGVSGPFICPYKNGYIYLT